jgi:hypothetical protein
MRGREDSVEWDGDRISVFRNGTAIAWGRWREGRIVERTGALGSAEENESAWQALELDVRRGAEAFLEATNAEMYDARGVDVTQVDRMLALSPGARLEAMEAQARAFVELVGNASRD